MEQGNVDLLLTWMRTLEAKAPLLERYAIALSVTFLGYLALQWMFRQQGLSVSKMTLIAKTDACSNKEPPNPEETERMPAMTKPLHLPYRPALRLDEKEMIDRAGKFYDLMEQRRSIRSFSDKAVPKELVHLLIRTAGK